MLQNRDLNLMLEKERRSASKWKYELQLLKEEVLYITLNMFTLVIKRAEITLHKSEFIFVAY